MTTDQLTKPRGAWSSFKRLLTDMVSSSRGFLSFRLLSFVFSLLSLCCSVRVLYSCLLSSCLVCAHAWRPVSLSRSGLSWWCLVVVSRCLFCPCRCRVPRVFLMCASASRCPRAVVSVPVFPLAVLGGVSGLFASCGFGRASRVVCRVSGPLAVFCLFVFPSFSFLRDPCVFLNA